MSTAEIDLFVDAAVAAAHVGGLVLREHSRNLQELVVDEKVSNDFVTAADRASEKAIGGFLLDRFPDHSLIAEESAEQHRGGSYTWIVDPLDGTTNFIHGYPVYAVSVCLRQDSRILAGAVYDPVRDEMFRAGEGRGAYLGDDPIHVAEREGLGGCLLGTGFPFKMQERLKEYLRSFEMFCRTTAGIRRAGAAALDLCAVACGRFDGFWEMALAPWDVGAGSLIVKEAGGVVTDFVGKEAYMKSGNIIAANPHVHAAMLEVVRRTMV